MYKRQVLFAMADSLSFFFKQKTAYEIRIRDCSSDVCSSDLSMKMVKYKVNQDFLKEIKKLYQQDDAFDI